METSHAAHEGLYNKALRIWGCKKRLINLFVRFITGGEWNCNCMADNPGSTSTYEKPPLGLKKCLGPKFGGEGWVDQFFSLYIKS